MIRILIAAGLICLLCAVGTVTAVGQVPVPTLPPIPGARFPRIEPPQADGLAAPRAIGAVDASRLKDRAEILNVDMIWDQSPHNAFTDLIHYRERWYMVFREGAGHVSPDGSVRVLSSADGVNWSTTFHIDSEYADIRDPKLSITNDRRLMLSAMAAYNPPTEINHQTLAWYTIDGRDWGIPFKIGDPGLWLWSVAWHRDSAYSLSYSTTQDRYLRMYMGPGGLRFQTLEDRVLEHDQPSEAALLFNRDDTALCLLRRDSGPRTAWLGLSRPPYRGWDWRDLEMRLEGPAILRLPDGRIVASGRTHGGGGPKTSLLWLDENDATLEEFLTLPSGGDNSYPGLAYHDDLLWVSYYSSHEGKASIYLAKVRLPELRKEKYNALPTY